MKALVVTPYYYPVGGGLETYARQLNGALKNQQDWDIVVVTTQSGLKSTIGSVDKCKVYRLGIWFKLSNTPFNLLWPVKMRKIIKQEKPDVIIAHAPVPSLADATALVAGTTPFVIIYHAATLYKKKSPIFNAAAWVYNRMSYYTFKRTDQIFAVSDFVAKQFSPKLQSITYVVPNAVWQSEIQNRKQPNGPHFVFIASLNKSHSWKGLSRIIDAIAAYKIQHGTEITLDVMGDGTNKSAYEAQVAKLGLQKNVIFHGEKLGRTKQRILQDATALIAYPTTANDAFPTVILEAWALSVPVICADIGPLPSIIVNDNFGFLCEADNPLKLADTMWDVQSLPNKTRSVLAQKTALRTKQMFTWEIQAARVNTLVKDLIKELA